MEEEHIASEDEIIAYNRYVASVWQRCLHTLHAHSLPKDQRVLNDRLKAAVGETALTAVLRCAPCSFAVPCTTVNTHAGTSGPF